MGRKNFPHEKRNGVTENAGCRSKVGMSKKAAESSCRRRLDRDGIEMRPYHCRYCNKWHVTHRELVK